jgi:hypothetical protein
MSWNDLFVNMDNTNFFNFSFLPKYGSAFVRGFEYTLLLAVVLLGRPAAVADYSAPATRS